MDLYRYRGKRMRIDYLLVSEKLKDRIVKCEMHGQGIELEGMNIYDAFSTFHTRAHIFTFYCHISYVLTFLQDFMGVITALFRLSLRNQQLMLTRVKI